MQERERWIEHAGRRILLHDYSHLAGHEYSHAIRDRVESLTRSRMSDVPLLLDVTDSFVNKDALAAFKQAGVDVKPHVRKIAVIGITGLQKYFLHLINQFSAVDARPFDSRAEALDWLIED
jgi:hypothetical protein